MPMYEYRCSACGQDFERYVATSSGRVACPSCASAEVKRKLSVFALKSDGSAVASSMPSGGMRSGGMPSGGTPSRGGCCGGGCSCH